MFDYLYFRDLGPLVMLWVAFTILISTFKTKRPFVYPIVIIFIFAIVQNIYQSYIFEENIELFNKNKKLECSVDRDKYLVEKSNGISIEKHYFVKDQLLILIVDCEEF